jgi:hypothetical protein
MVTRQVCFVRSSKSVHALDMRAASLEGSIRWIDLILIRQYSYDERATGKKAVDSGAMTVKN